MGVVLPMTISSGGFGGGDRHLEEGKGDTIILVGERGSGGGVERGRVEASGGVG